MICDTGYCRKNFGEGMEEQAMTFPFVQSPLYDALMLVPRLTKSTGAISSAAHKVAYSDGGTVSYYRSQLQDEQILHELTLSADLSDYWTYVDAYLIDVEINK